MRSWPLYSYELVAHDQTEVPFAERNMAVLKKLRMNNGD